MFKFSGKCVYDVVALYVKRFTAFLFRIIGFVFLFIWDLRGFLGAGKMFLH